MQDGRELDQHDKIDELEIIDEKEEQDELDRMLNGYHSDDELAALDDNKLLSLQQQNDTQHNKKRHLQTQESISDTDFFNRFDGPGLKNLNKQESIIEEEEPTSVASEMKQMGARVATTREVCTLVAEAWMHMQRTTFSQSCANQFENHFRFFPAPPRPVQMRSNRLDRCHCWPP